MVDFSYHLPQCSPDETVQRQARYFREVPDLAALLDVLPHFLLIVNRQRQIVFANHHVAETLQLEKVDHIYGLRPGELLDCPHVAENGGSCGETEACQSCGAHRAVRFCESGEHSIQECRILQHRSGRALDFRVSGTPVHVQGECFTVLALTDISHEKRRQTLERLFFHDLMNLATGIAAYSALLSRRPDSEHIAEAATAIRALVLQLGDEIKAQRELGEAENNELVVSPSPLGSLAMLRGVAGIYREHNAARGRELLVAPDAPDLPLVSDRTLVNRVLGNMVKNALEAIEPGQRVLLGCTGSTDAVEFWVQNPGIMPREVQLQVFQRSFSTKGRGRGLGTYSIKLLTEHYLNGKAWFTTSIDEGTTFVIRLPAALP